MSDGRRDASPSGRTGEVVAAVLGFLLGFVLSQPFACVSSVNGAEHTECQNLLRMSFTPPYWTPVGIVGGIAGALIFWSFVRFIRSSRRRHSSTG
jgi:hypothetical protein